MSEMKEAQPSHTRSLSVTARMGACTHHEPLCVHTRNEEIKSTRGKWCADYQCLSGMIKKQHGKHQAVRTEPCHTETSSVKCAHTNCARVREDLCYAQPFHHESPVHLIWTQTRSGGPLTSVHPQDRVLWVGAAHPQPAAVLRVSRCV